MPLNKEKFLKIVLALFLAGLAIASRFLPHQPNFTPVLAIALFSGFYLPRKIALGLPIAIMLFSDCLLGFYSPLVMASVYTSVLLAGLLGLYFKKQKSRRLAVGGGVLLSSLLFFLITNFAVWAFTPWYSKTLPGLFQCYMLALPFFKNTLAGTLFYSACLFGACRLAEFWLFKLTQFAKIEQRICRLEDCKN